MAGDNVLQSSWLQDLGRDRVWRAYTRSIGKSKNRRASDIDSSWLNSRFGLEILVVDLPPTIAYATNGEDSKSAQVVVLFLTITIAAGQIVSGVGVSRYANVCSLDVLFSGGPVGRSINVVVSLPGRVFDGTFKCGLVREDISANEDQAVKECFVRWDRICIDMAAIQEPEEAKNQFAKIHRCVEIARRRW
jgi:hypothetical protein